MIELNKIYCEDCLEGMRQMDAESVDLTVTSPPYDDLRVYNGYCFDFENIARELYRVTKQGGVVVWIVNDATIGGDETGTSFKQALFFKEIGFNLYDTMIYEKAGVPPPHPNRYFNAFEYMFVFSKGKPKSINIIADRKNNWGGCPNWGAKSQRNKDGVLASKGKSVVADYSARTNIWRYLIGYHHTTQDEVAFEHPAIFPELLVRDHVISWSNEGDIVLDPFMGSGTTAKVARALGRHYIGFEISAEYCNIIKQRLEQTRTFFDI